MADSSSKTVSQERDSKTWVLIAPERAMDAKQSPDIVKLRHPRTKYPVTFLFSANNTSVHEVLAFAQDKSSWFIGDTVQQDGKLHIATKIDPLFLALPYLVNAKNEGKTLPLDDLFVDIEYPESQRLASCLGYESLNSIADRKGGEEINAWAYNESKTMDWLKKKTEKLVGVLKEKNVSVDGSAVANTFIMSEKLKEGGDDESYLQYSCGLVSEYLPDAISIQLRKHLNLPEEVKQKRKSSTERGTNKKAKLDTAPGPLPSPAPKKTKEPTAKQKSQIRAAAGTKSITSFFKKI